MGILDELKLAADMADDLGEPGDGALYISAVGEIRKLRGKVAAMSTALGWYSDSRNWGRMKGNPEIGPKSWKSPAAEIDRGEMARLVLTQAIPHPEGHEELLEIHRIGMCIAECPPIVDTDTMTVKMVKEMAIRINQYSENPISVKHDIACQTISMLQQKHEACSKALHLQCEETKRLRVALNEAHQTFSHIAWHRHPSIKPSKILEDVEKSALAGAKKIDEINRIPSGYQNTSRCQVKGGNCECTNHCKQLE